jgi:hypothetical protein
MTTEEIQTIFGEPLQVRSSPTPLFINVGKILIGFSLIVLVVYLYKIEQPRTAFKRRVNRD